MQYLIQNKGIRNICNFNPGRNGSSHTHWQVFQQAMNILIKKKAIFLKLVSLLLFLM